MISNGSKYEVFLFSYEAKRNQTSRQFEEESRVC